jgi:cytochrome c553
MRSEFAKHLGLIALAVAGVALQGTASAQDYVARSWAASCASCHGTNGRSAGDIPSLAGRSKADLLLLLQEFKSGKSKGKTTIMHQYAVGYSDAQLERIAGYFAQQPR